MLHNSTHAEVERRISQVLHSKTKELYLNKFGLTELPQSLCDLTNLELLDLSDNRLTYLPDWLREFAQLRSLNLAHNQITTLPEWFITLDQLHSLDISFNKLQSISKWTINFEKISSVNLSSNQLMSIPKWPDNLSQLQILDISGNQIETLPSWHGKTKSLHTLNLSNNHLSQLSESIGELTGLAKLNLSHNKLTILPDTLGQLTQLFSLDLSTNELISIPDSLDVTWYVTLNLDNNPLYPELAAANENGLQSIKAYLRSKAVAQIIRNEAKLILVGEGEVGKTCLMDALLDNPWREHDTTHGIEIKPIKITEPEAKKEITLNGWDFGGQRIYRPTHQLFFSAPAVYLVVWKPREGPQQGFVKEWIHLVKRREPTAKIMVVATHGGPQQRQPDIDRQELWDLFGHDTIVGFFHVESRPNEKGERRGIEALKSAITSVAASLPEMGRSVPKRWQDVRDALIHTGAAYLPLNDVLELCRAHQMDDKEANTFITIEHRLGHLIHYEHDLTLRDIVVLKPDWLATAISFVLDDEITRNAHGLVRLSHLGKLWDNPSRTADLRYPKHLHPIFLRLMERFELSYRVADPSPINDSDPQSLIAQLVPDIRPENLNAVWPLIPPKSEIQQSQVCRIVDAQNGQPATAEGLFYQLIVRLQKYSLGRVNYNDSVHWQRGMVLDDEYNGCALLEYIDNDVRITVRGPFPQRLLALLTEDVRYLVKSFWEGLLCNVMVPCVEPCGLKKPGNGLYEIKSLIGSKREGFSKFPCPICNKWQDIDMLLFNAPAAQPEITELIATGFSDVKEEVEKARQQLSEKMSYQGDRIMGRFDRLDDRTRRTLSRVDKTYDDLIQIFTDEAREGPRLFSLVPIARSDFNPKEWVSEKFRLILWCEHARLPLPILNGIHSKKGVYELEFTRKWFKKAAPLLSLMTSVLGLVLPIVGSGAKLMIDKSIYEELENDINFGNSTIDSILKGIDETTDWTSTATSGGMVRGTEVRAENASLRELHALLKSKDPSFGGLVRVMNNRQQFLWVHEKFRSEY